MSDMTQIYWKNWSTFFIKIRVKQNEFVVFILKFLYVTIMLTYECYNFLITHSLQLVSSGRNYTICDEKKCSDQFVLKTELWTLVSRKLLSNKLS